MDSPNYLSTRVSCLSCQGNLHAKAYLPGPREKIAAIDQSIVLAAVEIDLFVKQEIGEVCAEPAFGYEKEVAVAVREAPETPLVSGRVAVAFSPQGDSKGCPLAGAGFARTQRRHVVQCPACFASGRPRGLPG